MAVMTEQDAAVPDGAELWLIRHGETEWSLAGKHTSVTDLPLTARGELQAAALRRALVGLSPSLVLCSPRLRAQATAKLAGLAISDTDPDLAEWNYGEYEGLTSRQIREQAPGWLLFRDGCPGGETPQDVGARADRVIARVREVDGNVALFAHGHILRVLAARWIALPASAGQHFLLDTGTLSVLGYYQETPAMKIWNAAFANAA